MSETNSAKPALRVGLAGLGTVGSGTHAVLTRNANEIRRRAGRDVLITALADLDQDKAQAMAKAVAATGQPEPKVFSDA
ncbi:MAG: hypothetical protein EBT14_06520, partial [Betaproteobacteria bacterium]|nr:hypothetical protein [Betaproteobacteria bacterium]